MSPDPLPAWLQPLPGAEQQRALDAWATNTRGIPGLELMEQAGAGLARACEERARSGAIAVVCGGGNNGGDGLVAARLLRLATPTRDVRVLLLGDPGGLRGDARANLDRLPGAAPQPFAAKHLDGVAVIVDAILGTGFSGEPREPARAAIAAINARRSAGAQVIACDVPSGVDASTGEVRGEAVQAEETVSFDAAKPGLWIRPGKQLAGEVSVVDIGIPADGRPGQAGIGLITEAVLSAIPRRAAESTKFSAGSVLVGGGSPGLTGAPAMAALAAARAGAGYVTVAAPASLVGVLAAKLLEVMQVELPERERALAPEAAGVLLERSGRVQALVLGPGLGRAPASLRFAREVARQAEVPLVLDADGLNAHAGGHLRDLRSRSAPAVLTPHAGELARLLGIDSDDVGRQRLLRAREGAAAAGAILVLKGDDTLVAEPDGRVAVNPGGASALATAGTGDVLSGVIAALLAKRMPAFEAACAAVFVHATAGRLAAGEIGPEGVIASDVIERLPTALRPSALSPIGS